MSSIIKNGVTFHGICVCGRGVFTYDEYQYGRRTYVGQIRDGHACGLGVTTYDNGTKEFGEHGPDGEEHGRILTRYAGGTTGYERQKRGVSKEYAEVHAYRDGDCSYNDWACAPDERRFLALIPCQGRSRRCPGETANDRGRCADKRSDGTATSLRASRAELAVF